ncbi:MAG: TMEM175 family protein [Thaumarchaeota archaeon]|nr:TMEM175 family protein [Nitrososphaerota archaeon]
MSQHPDEEGSKVPGLSKGRLEALTDGIFATVMTVLVLTLSVPVIAGTLTGSQLTQDLNSALQALLPNVLSYAMSFLLLAVMWISHHSVFHYIKTLDRPMIWLNILFLLSIGLVPFSTALLGRYPLEQLAVIIYGVNVVGISISMLAFLSYGVRSGSITLDLPGATIIKTIIGRWRLGSLIYSSAVLISFVDTELSVIIYVLALCFYVISSSIGFKPLIRS